MSAGADGPGEARPVRRGQRPAGPGVCARRGRALPQPLPPLPARLALPVQVPLQLNPYSLTGPVTSRTRPESYNHSVYTTPALCTHGYISNYAKPV